MKISINKLKMYSQTILDCSLYRGLFFMDRCIIVYYGVIFDLVECNFFFLNYKTVI